jgi:hypothetical protein
MGNLTLDEVVGSPGYAAVSSSAPTPQSQWEPRPRTHEDSSTIIYEESTGYSAVPSIVPAYTTAYDEKGKGIATEGPVSYPPGNQDSRVISGTDGDTEPLDPSYAVRRKDWKSFFRQGRVFSTLWTDAFADITNESEYNQFPSVVSYRVAYNERVHSKIRRFVVVKFGDRYCTCLPVTTYNRRGYRKGGIDLNEHGLIYSDKREPASIRGIKKKALKVSLSPGADKLINPSYINYGRVYTVETNVKVKDVGELNSDSRRLLRQYWNECQTVPEDDEGSASVQTHAAVLTGVGSGFTESSQDYMGGPSSALGPFPPSMTSSSAHYGSYAGYRQPGYGHSSGWQNTGYLAQSNQHSYAIPGPTYEPQTGPSHGSGAGNFVYTATQYDMPQRSSASEYPTPIDSRYGQRGSVSARDELPSSGYARDELPSSGYASNISQVYPSNADPHSTHSRFSSHGDSTAPISDDRYQHHDYYSQEGHISAAQASSHEQYPAIVSSGEGQYPPADDSARYSSEAHHSSSRAQDLEYRPYDDDDPSLVMPTLEEVQASRRYRHGSMSGGSRTHTARGREGRGRRR